MELEGENASNFHAFSIIQYNKDPITETQRRVVALVAGVFLCTIISLFGSVTNVIKLIIFYKQGLNTTINISFFSLAIADLGSLVFQQLFSLYCNPLFENLDLPIVYLEFQYYTTAIIREIFARITCLITTYITAERCFCIAFPLHVKQMITPRRSTVIIIAIYVFMFLFSSSAYSTAYIDWAFYPERNRTLLGLIYTKSKEAVEGSMYLLHGVVGFLSFIIIVLLTAVLIYKLQQKNTWLQSANVDAGKSESMSSRDRATMSMVILISSILIISYAPSVILFAVPIFEPEFPVGGSYYNMFYILWTFALLLENINSSVNIFFYYKMSTKYRQTFRELFVKCLGKDSGLIQ